MKIEILSHEVKTVERKGATGNTFTIRTQEALIKGRREVKEFDLRLEDGQVAYPVGLYEIGSRSLTVDAYGRLQLGKLTLEPVPPTGKG